MIQLVKYLLQSLVMCNLMTTVVWSQGVSLNSVVRTDVRFVSKEDPLMGVVVLDTDSGLEYMRCLVGQKYLRYEADVATQCKDEPQLLSFNNALKLVQQVGFGWRLPTIVEMQQIMHAKTYVNSIFWTEPPYRGALKGGFWTVNVNDKSQFLNLAAANGLSAAEAANLKELGGFVYPEANGSLAQVRLVRRR